MGNELQELSLLGTRAFYSEKLFKELIKKQKGNTIIKKNKNKFYLQTTCVWIKILKIKPNA